jgi:hypothetical protein
VGAEHDGYQRLPGRPLHRRSVFHRRGAATFVVDRLLGDGSHQAELTWHLPHGAAVTAAGENAWAADGDGFRLWLALLSDGAADTVIVEGQEPGEEGSHAIRPQGWVSPRFGVRVPAPVLCSRRGGPLPMAWVTALMPTTSGEALPTVHGRVDARGVVVTVTHAGGRVIYAQAFMDHNRGAAAPPTLDLGEGRFQGQAAHLLLDEAGRLLEFCGVGGLELEWEGRTVWRAANGCEDAHVVLLPPDLSGGECHLSFSTETAVGSGDYR